MLVRREKGMLPNFLIIGAEKSATTWLYSKLKKHPGIFMPRTKELHFFNKYRSNLEMKDNYVKLGLNWYKNFFKDCNGQKAVGEATPMYLCDSYAPARIKETLGDIKLIAILRNPVDRAYSHYWMARSKGYTDLTFEEVVEQKTDKFIKRGLYYKQIKRYLKYFDRDDMLIILFEDVIKCSEKVLKEIYRFLEVDTEFIPSNVNESENVSGEYKSLLLLKMISGVTKFFRRKVRMGFVVDFFKKIGFANFLKQLNKRELDYPDMDDGLRKKLVDYYKEQNKNLADLLDEDLRCWNQ